MNKKRKYCHKIKKDYQAKKLSNPFFRKKAKKETGKSFKKIKTLLIFISLIFFVWLLFCSPWLRISKLELKGANVIKPELIKAEINAQIEKSGSNYFSQKNIFLFKRKVAVSNLQENFNLVEVKIRRSLPNKLLIQVQERPYAFIYQENDVQYFASADNYIMGKIELRENNEADDNRIEVIKSDEGNIISISEEEKQKYFVIENKNNISLVGKDEKLILDQAYLNFIIALKDEFLLHPEFVIEKFIIADQYFNSIFVKIKEGPQIYFNVNNEAREQLENLILVKNNKIKDNFSMLEYIDLRYGDKIYFFPENINNESENN